MNLLEEMDQQKQRTNRAGFGVGGGASDVHARDLHDLRRPYRVKPNSRPSCFAAKWCYSDAEDLSDG